MYMPNPNDVMQALDVATGDPIWEHRRDVPDDVADYMLPSRVEMVEINRNVAICGNLIIDTSVDATSSPST